MSERLRIILLAALAAAQLAGFAVIIDNHFDIEQSGERALLQIRFNNPHSRFLSRSGRYLRLRHDLSQFQNRIKRGAALNSGDEAYLVLAKDPDGYIHPMGLASTPPDRGLYLKTYIKRNYCSRPQSDEGSCKFQISRILDRYYVQDDIAIGGEKLFRSIARAEWEHKRKERARRKAAAEASEDPTAVTERQEGAGNGGESPDADAEASSEETAGDPDPGQQEGAGEEERLLDTTADAPGLEMSEVPIGPLRKKIWAELRIADGKAVIIQLYIDGKTIEQAVKEYRQDNSEDTEIEELLRQAQ